MENNYTAYVYYHRLSMAATYIVKVAFGTILPCKNDHINSIFPVRGNILQLYQKFMKSSEFFTIQYIIINV
jgi:hypothetical protein